MSGWAGFSDEELRKMQQKDSSGPTAAGRGRKPAPAANRTRQQLQRERALQLAAQRSAGSAGAPPELPPEQQLTKPPPPPQKKKEPEPRPHAAPGEAPGVRQEVKPTEKHLPSVTEKEESLVVKELETEEVAMREKSRLEQLQQEQKIIEERNKRKKALLTKTIAEKSKQTQAEAVKLKRIQKELQALDDMVSNDIGILRGKIEEASWDFTAARKRYEKAEAEYVAAKLDLHRKTEAKEQLTEHLCAIIQQNELRKAHKLEELMQQLQLQATEEEEMMERQKREEEEKEEEEERKKRSQVEKQGNGSVEVKEELPKDCGVKKEKEKEEEEEEGGGGDTQPKADAPQTEQDCKTAENNVQAEAVAS